MLVLKQEINTDSKKENVWIKKFMIELNSLLMQ